MDIEESWDGRPTEGQRPQWLSTFLMLRLFTTVPRVLVTSNCKIILVASS